MAWLAPRTMIVAVLVGGAVTGLAATQLLAQDGEIGAARSIPGITAAIQPTVIESTTVAPTTVAPTTLAPTTLHIAPAATTTTPSTIEPTTSAPPTPAERGREALALIDYEWQSRLDGWSIVFAPGRDGVLGLTYVDRKTIEIFVRDNQTPDLLAHVIAHEMGHAVDVTLNDSGERQRWQESRGISSAPWWPGDGATDFSTGAGDFAESFAAWQVGSGNFRSKLSGAPDAGQLDLMAELSES